MWMLTLLATVIIRMPVYTVIFMEYKPINSSGNVARTHKMNAARCHCEGLPDRNRGAGTSAKMRPAKPFLASTKKGLAVYDIIHLALPEVADAPSLPATFRIRQGQNRDADKCRRHKLLPLQPERFT
ncbi:hypothetical protein OE88DRAFT_1641304 [Heliocybe sulcata]|uniref:Uncharacterized protein n=1 Tax=Heliocybe sulcata TaxID=5364 RepID=A0A5C3NNZ9_9AGAM|nr:hypothetical protein OE88DRAFT_1641304 [Heliocybe sulcata]